MSRINETKLETIKQWNNDPVGSQVAIGLSPEEQAYWDKVDEGRYVEYAPWMLEALEFDQHAGKRVLELGFGLGADLMSFARNGADVWGVDITPGHIALAQKRFALSSYEPKLIEGDVEVLPLASESFDVIYSFGVLHHTPNILAAVDELYRVLKPNGYAIIGLYHRHSYYYWLQTMLYRGFLKRELFKMSYARFLSKIEMRENSDAVPLINLYTKRSTRKLFREFTKIEIIIQHVSEEHIWLPPLPFGLHRTVSAFLMNPKRASQRGWYIICKLTK